MPLIPPLSKTFVAAASMALVAATPALAEGPSDAVGDVGLTFGYTSVDDGEGAEAGVGFAAVDGSFSFQVAPGILLGFDANARLDDLGSDPNFNDSEDPKAQYAIGVHALWDMGSDTRLGGFLAYGDTVSQDQSTGDEFDYYLVGLEAQHFVTNDILGYAQVGLGGKVRDGDDDEEGFLDGKALRIGATYFAGENSAFTLDLEFGSASPYIDGDDDGVFFGATVSGETRLPTAAPLSATYFLRYDQIDATTEDDEIAELQVGVGLRFLFGATSPREAARAGRSIGTPYLPSRASAWTEFID